MSKLKILIIFLIAVILVNARISYCNQFKKGVSNEDRFKNISTEMSAIKVFVKDKVSGERFIIIVGNQIFYDFMKGERNFTYDDYVHFMVKNENNEIPVDVDRLKKYLSIPYGVKGSKKVEELFKKKYLVGPTLSFEDLDVKTEVELVTRYFDFTEPSGSLKLEFYKKSKPNDIFHTPSFVDLLLSLGYEVTWEDYSGVLRISTKPFIEIGGKSFVQ